MLDKIERCSRCILPTDLPSVTLDSDGVCNQCKMYERQFSNWGNTISEKQKEFEDLVHKTKKMNRLYDCLIPLSGGKDSTYVLYVCSKIYNLKCLCVTFDNGFLSDHAKKNIENAILATNADHFYYTINRNMMMELYKLFLQKTGNFCVPCLRGIGVAMQIAENYKIPTIISGGGSRVAYLSPITELFQNGDISYFRGVLKGEPLEKKVKHMYIETSSWNFRKIMRIGFNLLRIPDPNPKHYISLYDYLDVSFDKIYKMINREMGWEKPDDQYEHMDCKVHEIVPYIHRKKFHSLTPTTFHHSGMIRMSRMQREEAIEIENNNLKHPKVPAMLDYFLNEIGVNENEFEDAVRDWQKITRYRRRKVNTIKSIYHKLAGIN